MIDGYELRSAARGRGHTHLLRPPPVSRLPPGLRRPGRPRAAALPITVSTRPSPRCGRPTSGFTDAEAADPVGQLRSPAPAGVVHDLNVRLGGWAAGLRFTARALTRHEHPVDSAGRGGRPGDSGTSRSTCSRRSCRCRSPEARDLLLRTCVPDLLPPGLAEELAGPNAPRGIAELVRSNMFIEPVPDRPGSTATTRSSGTCCVRPARLRGPREAAELHRRAAGWLRTREMRGRARWPSHAATGAVVGRRRCWSTDGSWSSRWCPAGRAPGRVARRVPDEHAAACIVRAALALAAADPASRRGADAGPALARGPHAAVRRRPCRPALAFCDHSTRPAPRGLRRPPEPAEERLERTLPALGPGPPPAWPDPSWRACYEVARRRDRATPGRPGPRPRRAGPGLPTSSRGSAHRSARPCSATGRPDGRASRAVTQARTPGPPGARAGRRRPGLAPEPGRPAPPRWPWSPLERDDLGAARRHLAAARVCRALVCETRSLTTIVACSAASRRRRRAAVAALAHLEALCDRATSVTPGWPAGCGCRSAELGSPRGLPRRPRCAARAGGDQRPSHLRRPGRRRAAYAEQGRRASSGPWPRARAELPPAPVEVTPAADRGVNESPSGPPAGARPSSSGPCGSPPGRRHGGPSARPRRRCDGCWPATRTCSSGIAWLPAPRPPVARAAGPGDRARQPADPPGPGAPAPAARHDADRQPGGGTPDRQEHEVLEPPRGAADHRGDRREDVRLREHGAHPRAQHPAQARGEPSQQRRTPGPRAGLLPS